MRSTPPIFLPLALLVVGGIALWAGPPPPAPPWDFRLTAPYGDADDPFRVEALEERLRRIAPLVGRALGEPIDVTRVKVRLADERLTAEAALARAYPHLADAAHERYDSTRASFAHAWTQALVSSYLARYVADEETIEVFPFAFEGLAPADPDRLLDVVLAHELVHVWQDQRRGAFAHEGVEATSEEALAAAAVIEGGAEFVSRAVARELGASAAWEQIAATRSEHSPSGPWAAHARNRWVRWAYGEGLRFVEAVHARLGATTWKHLFEAMPASVAQIERPGAWLDGHLPAAASLDAWAERLQWCLEAVPPESELRSAWGWQPFLRAEVEARLAQAELTPGAAPWDGCRGGVRLAGTPRRGALADEAFLLRAWRFPSAIAAREARAGLEAAFERLGIRVWSGGEAETLGMPRVRRGAADAVVRTSLVFDGDALHPREGSWGLRTDGSVLLEIACWREGCAPALLDVLDLAVRARTDGRAIDAARGIATESAGPWARLSAGRGAPTREHSGVTDLEDAGRLPAVRDDVLARMLTEPRGEASVLRWLVSRPDDAAAWMSALGPAAGAEDEEYLERGPVLDAALDHGDADVVRFALAALADRRVAPGPFCAGVTAAVVRLCAHEDAAVRALAVRAAEALIEDEPLEAARVDALAEDPSPAVRAALATCHETLRRRKGDVGATLAQDPHPAVRRAATADPEAGAGFADRLLSRAMHVVREQELPSEPESEDVDTAAAFRLLFDAMFSGTLKADQGALARKLRRFLRDGGPEVRVLALQSIQHLKEGRAQFLPDLVRALGEAAPRRAALFTLQKGGLDLSRARGHLLACLEHPAWRADVLRVLAANRCEVPTSLHARLRAWRTSSDARIRVAAAMLLIRIRAPAEAAAEAAAGIEADWAAVPVDYRVQALETLARHRPHDAVTERLRGRALRSAHHGLRHAVTEEYDDGVFDQAAMDALLQGMDDVGPEVAAEHWMAFLDEWPTRRPRGIRRAGEVFARHLDRWRVRGHPPRVSVEALERPYYRQLTRSPRAVDALDACLEQLEPSTLLFALAKLRAEVDEELYPESPALRAALNRLYALEQSPSDLSRHAEDDFTDQLNEREGVTAAQIRSVILRSTRAGSRIDVEGLIEGKADRITVALDLVPELLERGTVESVGTALAILEAAGPAGDVLLPSLRRYVGQARRLWRGSIERLLERHEERRKER